MAIWEYRCTIVPIGKLNLLTSKRLTIGEIDSLGLWAGTQVSALVECFPPQLSQRKGWTENLTILQLAPTYHIEIYALESEVLDVEVLIDCRQSLQGVLSALASICCQNHWKLMDDELHVFSVGDECMIESMRVSPAGKFVVNPREFLTREAKE